jgi:hypothetical protein
MHLRCESAVLGHMLLELPGATSHSKVVCLGCDKRDPMGWSERCLHGVVQAGHRVVRVDGFRGDDQVILQSLPRKDVLNDVNRAYIASDLETCSDCQSPLHMRTSAEGPTVGVGQQREAADIEWKREFKHTKIMLRSTYS